MDLFLIGACAVIALSFPLFTAYPMYRWEHRTRRTASAGAYMLVTLGWVLWIIVTVLLTVAAWRVWV